MLELRAVAAAAAGACCKVCRARKTGIGIMNRIGIMRNRLRMSYNTMCTIRSGTSADGVATVQRQLCGFLVVRDATLGRDRVILVRADKMCLVPRCSAARARRRWIAEP